LFDKQNKHNNSYYKPNRIKFIKEISRPELTSEILIMWPQK